MHRILTYLLAISLAALFWSCQKEKSGVIDPSYDTPQLLGASLNRSSFNLDSLTAGTAKIGPTQYSVTVSVSALASANYSGGGINHLRYRIVFPGSNDEIASGSLNNVSPGVPPADSSFWVHVNGTIAFTVYYADKGIYFLDLTAFDNTNTESNTIRLPITVSRRNVRPQVSAVVAPDTINRPRFGFVPYTFTVTAFDSDGHSDLNAVYFNRTIPAASGNPIPMYDDGNQLAHGDMVAGDGVFSVTVQIQNNARLGNQTFAFWAVDNSGAVSDSVFHTITIR